MFTPTFIDLVRNYTKTSGVGDFVLGAAVSGYRSFTDAVKTGDSFYYSATGIDRPDEFEVGRGTMQSDGTIKREPLGGVATDFGTGFKAVALVAAAEWYQAIQGGAASQVSAGNSRQAVAAMADKSKPALLHEPRRQGLFLYDAGDFSGQVASDPVQAVYIAPESDKSGRSGAWVRNFDGPLQAGWFGVAADGVTDDYAALNAALSLADTLGKRHVMLGKGVHKVGTTLLPADDMVIEGTGPDTIISSTALQAFSLTGKSRVKFRDLKITPLGTGATLRSGIILVQCTGVTLENVVIEGQTDCTGIFMFDCTGCVVDKYYYDGGALYHGNGIYNSGGQDCKVINSHAVNCFAGFTISGYDVDRDINPLGAAARTSAQSYGNSIVNCTVRNCSSQAYTITCSTYNRIDCCSAEDYGGTSTHKAFQTKDVTTFGTPDATAGNVISNCTVKNYPAGFGAQESSHTQFIGCTTTGNSTNAFEFNSASDCRVLGGSAREFQQNGIYINGGTVRCHFDGITLETATATATGISLLGVGGNDQVNNFDNIITRSSLAYFIDIAAGCTGNRFGPGCRPNSNPINDLSKASVWPLVYRTDVIALNSVSSKYGVYSDRGMHVAAARFVVTAPINGTPSVCAGRLGAVTAIAPVQPVSGTAGSVIPLTIASQILAPRSVMSGTTAVAGTGEGYVQFEGLPA